jgi:FSR family fosmidomycin resistance protein-like MFS transporter
VAGVEHRLTGQERRGTLVAAALAHFLNDGNSVLFTILIIYYRSLGLSLSYLGAAAALYNLISGLVSERVGYWADRTARRGYMMGGGILLLGIAGIVFALSFLYVGYAGALLLPAVALLGLGLSFYHPIGGSIIANAMNGVNAARHMGINGSFGSLGRSLFPILVVLLLGLLGQFGGLLSLGLITLLLAIIIITASREFDRRMVTERSRMSHQAPPLRPFRRFIFLLTLVFLLNAVFSSGITTFIPAYLNQVSGSTRIAGLVTTLIYVTPIVGQVVLGFLTDRVGGRKVLYLTTASSAAVIATFLITGSFAIQVLLLSLFSFFVFSGFPVVLGYASQVVPRQYVGRLNGIVWGLGSTVGGAVGASLAGFLVDGYGFSTAFTVSLLFGVLSVALLPLVPSSRIGEGDMKEEKPLV